MRVKDGKLLKYEGNEKEPVIPAGVTEICAGAFRDCAFLETILIPENVRVIGERAFAGCTGLKEVYLTAAADIREQAFQNCVSLAMLYVPYNTDLRKNSFENCAGLRRFYRWARPYLATAWSEGLGSVQIEFEDLPYRMSDFLPDCRFIRCNDLTAERNREYLEEIFRYTEKQEERYRRDHGNRNRCDTAYDEYDHRLVEGKRVTVLACGSSGARIAAGITAKIRSDDVYLAGISPAVTLPEFQGLPQHIALYEDNQNCRCQGLSPAGFPEIMMPDALTYLHKYLPVIKNSRKIFVVGGAAGPAVWVLSRLIVLAASYYGIPVKMFLAEPSAMEGVKRHLLGKETLQFLRDTGGKENVVTDGLVFEHDDLAHIPGNWEMRKAEIIRKVLAALAGEGIK